MQTYRGDYWDDRIKQRAGERRDAVREARRIRLASSLQSKGSTGPSPKDCVLVSWLNQPYNRSEKREDFVETLENLCKVGNCV